MWVEGRWTFRSVSFESIAKDSNWYAAFAESLWRLDVDRRKALASSLSKDSKWYAAFAEFLRRLDGDKNSI